MDIKRADRLGRLTIGRRSGIDPGIEYNVEHDENTGVVTLTPVAVKKNYRAPDPAAFMERWKHLWPEVSVEKAFGAAAPEVIDALQENEVARKKGEGGVFMSFADRLSAEEKEKIAKGE